MTLKTDGPSNAEIVKWIGGSIQDLTIATAEEVLKREVGRGLFTTSPVVVTDGMPRKDYHAVKPFGRIEFIEQPVMGDCIRWSRALLIRLSPHGPGRNGHYADRHVVLLNGVGVTGDSDFRALDRAKPGDRVQIVNIQPYARKIEGARANRRKQWKGRRGLSRQAPGGVYRKALPLIQQRWGRLLFVDYRLERLEMGGKEWVAKGPHASKGGFYTFPVLNFFIKPSTR